MRAEAERRIQQETERVKQAAPRRRMPGFASASRSWPRRAPRPTAPSARPNSASTKPSSARSARWRRRARTPINASFARSTRPAAKPRSGCAPRRPIASRPRPSVCAPGPAQPERGRRRCRRRPRSGCARPRRADARSRPRGDRSPRRAPAPRFGCGPRRPREGRFNQHPRAPAPPHRCERFLLGGRAVCFRPRRRRPGRSSRPAPARACEPSASAALVAACFTRSVSCCARRSASAPAPLPLLAELLLSISISHGSLLDLQQSPVGFLDDPDLLLALVLQLLVADSQLRRGDALGAAPRAPYFPAAALLGFAADALHLDRRAFGCLLFVALLDMGWLPVTAGRSPRARAMRPQWPREPSPPLRCGLPPQPRAGRALRIT